MQNNFKKSRNTSGFFIFTQEYNKCDKIKDKMKKILYNRYIKTIHDILFYNEQENKNDRFYPKN